MQLPARSWLDHNSQHLQRALFEATSTDSDRFVDEYIADAHEALEYLAPIALQRFTSNKQGTGPHHAYLVFEVGIEALRLLSALNYRTWTQHQEDLYDQYARLTWRRLWFWGAGYITSNHVIRRASHRGSWTPTVSLNEFLGGDGYTYEPSNRAIAPEPLEQMMYANVFGTETSDALVGMALLDSFAQRPNPDNPIAAAIKKASRKTLTGRSVPLPHWWTRSLADRYCLDLNENVIEPDQSELGDPQADAPVDTMELVKVVTTVLGKELGNVESQVVIQCEQTQAISVPDGVQGLVDVCRQQWPGVTIQDLAASLVEIEAVEMDPGSGAPRTVHDGSKMGWVITPRYRKILQRVKQPANH